MNGCGEIFGFCLTPGNKDDRNPEVMRHLTKNIFGKLFADKGYISKKLANKLQEDGIQLVTKQRKNAKTKDVIYLRNHLYSLGIMQFHVRFYNCQKANICSNSVMFDKKSCCAIIN